MDELLKARLEPGEKILWQGTPESFQLLDRTNIGSFLKDICTCLLGGAAIAAEYWYFSGMRALPMELLWIVLLLVAVPVCFLISDTLKLRRTKYYVSDRRLAVVNNSVKDVAFSRIREASLKQDSCGHTTLLCGPKALRDHASSYRARTVLGLDALDGDDTICDSFAFYAVNQPEELKNALSGVLSLS